MDSRGCTISVSRGPLTRMPAMFFLRGWAVFVLITLFLVPTRSAVAHPIPFSYLDLRLGSNKIEASLVAHMIDLAHELNIDQPELLLDPEVAGRYAREIADVLEPRLTLVAGDLTLVPTWADLEVMPDRQSVKLYFSYGLESIPGSIAVTVNFFPYDPKHQTFLNIYENGSLRTQAILDINHQQTEYFTGTWQGTGAVIQKFVPQGVHHILIGPDHILFLVGLLLLGGTIRQLLVVVTSFTLAHSITLSLAVLNVVNPPAHLVEPAIALSIVCVGADNLLVGDGRDMRAWIALGFGLIHGFGFASVLRAMELPTRDVAWSLFSFNVGVEVGQLVIVAIAACLLTVLRGWSEIAGRRLAVVGSVVVILAGTFWFVERVFFPGGML